MTVQAARAGSSTRRDGPRPRQRAKVEMKKFAISTEALCDFHVGSIACAVVLSAFKFTITRRL